MIVLYKKGERDTVTREGKTVKCIAKKFAVKHLEAAKKAGWCVNPLEIVSKPGRKSPDPVQPVNMAVTRGVPDANKD